MKDILIFGRGRYFETKKEKLLKDNKIIGFLDNNHKDTMDNGIPVYAPEKALDFPDTDVYIMSIYFDEMYVQLHNMGVKDEHIFFGNNLEPYNGWDEKLFGQLKGRLDPSDGRIRYVNENESFYFLHRDELLNYARSIYRRENPIIDEVAKLGLHPVSRNFGCERGKAIDRFYIETFLAENADLISGDAMEIADTKYINQFGKKVKNAYALHVKGWGADVIKGNLETGEGITENMMDCLICTQTLQVIYDTKAVIKNIYKLLKPGGSVLVTASGITPISMYDYKNWGHFWNFTDQSLNKLFSDVFGQENVKVKAYGNIKTATGFLLGLCQEDLKPEDFEYYDEQFQVTVTVVARKSEM